MHAVQINFVPVPQGAAPAEVFERWSSLADIPEAVASAGVRVSVIQAAAHFEQFSRNGIDYYFTDLHAMDTVAIRAGRIATLLDRLKADVLHVHGLEFARRAFALKQSLPQLPILLQDHANGLPRRWRRSQWRRWYAAASGMAFTALDLAQPFVRAGLFAASTELFAIPESSSRFMPGDKLSARMQTGLHGDPCVLWVGHLSPGKDPLTVLEGIARVASRLPGLQLWCAFGDAPMREQVDQFIRRHASLAGRVTLLGKVPHAQVELLMRAADIFVSGSHAESCGYAALEAIACGVVPVLTDIPAFRALTADGCIGQLWPCGDAGALAQALLRVAADIPSSAQIRAHFDASLSFGAVGRQWADAYARLLADHHQRRAG